MDKTGEDWEGLHLGNFEKRRPTFFQIYVSLYQNIIYTAGKSFSVVMWPWFCKRKTLALPIWRLELIIGKIKQNYLKKRDLALKVLASRLVCSSLDQVAGVRALASDIVLSSWEKHLTFTVPLSTQVYKWVPTNLMLGVTLWWSSIPSRESTNTPSGFMLQKLR